MILYLLNLIRFGIETGWEKKLLIDVVTVGDYIIVEIINTILIISNIFFLIWFSYHLSKFIEYRREYQNRNLYNQYKKDIKELNRFSKQPTSEKIDEEFQKRLNKGEDSKKVELEIAKKYKLNLLRIAGDDHYQIVLGKYPINEIKFIIKGDKWKSSGLISKVLYWKL